MAVPKVVWVKAEFELGSSKYNLTFDLFRKAKTKRGKRFLENREPKVIENVKKAMFIKGGKTNECVTKALKNFVSLVFDFKFKISIINYFLLD